MHPSNRRNESHHVPCWSGEGSQMQKTMHFYVNLDNSFFRIYTTRKLQFLVSFPFFWPQIKCKAPGETILLILMLHHFAYRVKEKITWGFMGFEKLFKNTLAMCIGKGKSGKKEVENEGGRRPSEVSQKNGGRKWKIYKNKNITRWAKGCVLEWITFHSVKKQQARQMWWCTALMPAFK